MTRRRKVPLRVCVSCQEKKPKKSLIRIVRTPQGEVEIDRTGKKSGRGAYLCMDEECLRKARKGKKLEKHLKHPIPDGFFDTLNSTIKESAQSQGSKGELENRR